MTTRARAGRYKIMVSVHTWQGGQPTPEAGHRSRAATVVADTLEAAIEMMPWAYRTAAKAVGIVPPGPPDDLDEPMDDDADLTLWEREAEASDDD